MLPEIIWIDRYRIRGNIDMGLIYWLVGSSSIRGGDGVKGVEWGTHFNHGLKYLFIRVHKIWYNIQVIIHRLMGITTEKSL